MLCTVCNLFPNKQKNIAYHYCERKVGEVVNSTCTSRKSSSGVMTSILSCGSQRVVTVLNFANLTGTCLNIARENIGPGKQM